MTEIWKDEAVLEECDEEEILYTHGRNEEEEKEHKAIYSDDQVLIDVIFFDDGRFDRISIAHRDGWSVVSKEIDIHDNRIDFGSDPLFCLKAWETADDETVEMIKAIQNFFNY